MKITVKIADALLYQAKRIARQRSTTISELIEEGLRHVIEHPRQEFVLRDGSFGSGGMVRPMSWDEIRDEVYQGRGA